MTATATPSRDRSPVYKTIQAAALAYEIQQMADGRAAYRNTANAAALGDSTPWTTDGQVAVAKTSGIVLLDGGRVYLDRSAGTATFKASDDRDYYLGVAVGDAQANDATVMVNLNVAPTYVIDLHGGPTLSACGWTTEQTNGLGVTLLPGGGAMMAFDAVAEVAQAAIYSERVVSVDANPIAEFRVDLADQGNNAALNINIGLATGSDATDFQSVANFVTIRFKGNDLSIWAESDDGTTDVAAVDSTLDMTAGTYREFWIDCRSKASVGIYCDGVQICTSTTFTLTAASGPMKFIAEMTKTSDATTGDVRICFARVRTAEQ